MSRIGARDSQSPPPGGRDAAPRDGAGSRRDERHGLAKGTAGRDARLGAQTGRDGGGKAARTTEASAEAFGRSLDGALSQEARARGETGSEPGPGEDRRDHADQDRADPALAALLTGLQVPPRPAPTGPGPAAPTSTDAAASTGAAGRRATLSHLWAQETEAAGGSRTVSAAGPTAARDEAADRPVAAVGASGERRLLAEAKGEEAMLQAAGPGVPAPSLRAPEAGGGSGAESGPTEGGPTAGERVAKVAETVERAIRAEDTPPPGQVVSIDIPLDPQGHGLGGVTVALAAERIDVVLASGGIAATADLRAAAQALADRLQRRFPNRAIRVFDEPGQTATSDRRDATDLGST